jgi:protein arginine kinase activator
MKCNKCPKVATLHITEIVTEEQVEEHHLCEDCAQKYLYEPNTKSAKAALMGAIGEEADDPGAAVLGRECPVCGMKFVDFRNSGRLGCPHDYEAFKEDLAPLLENIHGDTRHCGKTPRRLPQARQSQSELVELRKKLMQAIHKEAYEEAAELRDRIRRLEEG